MESDGMFCLCLADYFGLLFSHSVISNSLRPHGLQHTRLPCSSPSPRACLNWCPSSRWCHPTISSCRPFLLLPSIVPSIRVFLMSWLFASGGQRIGVSASASVLPMNSQDWFPLGWTGWIFLQSKGLSRVFSNTTVQKHQFFSAQFSLWSNSPLYITTGKTKALTRWTFAGKVMSLLFNMKYRLVIAFFPRSKRLLISWLQSPSAVIFGAQENKVSHCFPCFPIYLPWSDGTRCHDLRFFQCWVLSQLFPSPLSNSSRGTLVHLRCHESGVICISKVIDILPGNLDSSLCFIQPRISHDVLCI